MVQSQPGRSLPGVTIASGATDWQVFPRGDEDTATVMLAGTVRAARITPEPPFSFEPGVPGELVVSARVVSEVDGGAVVPWRTARVAGADWAVELTVPVGGAYRIETQVQQSGADGYSLTRGDVVRHFYVGDLYLVLGQSNAAGRARDQVEDGPQLGVNQFRADGRWGLAAHPLNDGTRAVFTGHFENHNTGHSPALGFAKRIHTATGIPIGLVVAAFGGSPLRWWVEPDGSAGPLTANALDLLAAAGGRARGVLWYQGEADCFEATAHDYAARFARFVGLLRERLGDARLPFYTAQLCRSTTPPAPGEDDQWGMLREQQRRAAHDIPGVYLAPTGDLPLYDFIHLSSAGNLVLAARLADIALAQEYGLVRHWRAPEPVAVSRRGERTVALEFAPILNWINDFDLPAARCPFEVVDAAGQVPVSGWRVDDDTIVLELARALTGDAVAHHGWRKDHGGVVPSDCTRLPFLSFYGVPIP